MEQLVIDCENFGDDQQSLRETQTQARAIGCEIMNFSNARYPSVRVGLADITCGSALTKVDR